MPQLTSDFKCNAHVQCKKINNNNNKLQHKNANAVFALCTDHKVNL